MGAVLVNLHRKTHPSWAAPSPSQAVLNNVGLKHSSRALAFVSGFSGVIMRLACLTSPHGRREPGILR